MAAHEAPGTGTTLLAAGDRAAAAMITATALGQAFRPVNAAA